MSNDEKLRDLLEEFVESLGLSDSDESKFVWKVEDMTVPELSDLLDKHGLK